MGQKTIPQSLRLDYLKNWNSNWICDKKDYFKLFYLDNMLRNYIESYCKNNNFLLDKVILKKNNNFLNFYLYLYSQDIKKEKIDTLFIDLKKNMEKDVNKYCKYLQLPYLTNFFIVELTTDNLRIIEKKKNNIKTPFYLKNFVKISYKAFYIQSASLLNSYLTLNLKKIPKHKQYLNNINKILKKQLLLFNNCIGYKLQLKGRVNGLGRSKKFILKEGKTPLNTLKIKVIYDFKEILTPYGICSLKVWLFFKQN